MNIRQVADNVQVRSKGNREWVRVEGQAAPKVAGYLRYPMNISNGQNKCHVNVPVKFLGFVLKLVAAVFFLMILAATWIFCL